MGRSIGLRQAPRHGLEVGRADNVIPVKLCAKATLKSSGAGTGQCSTDR